jgi:hypothetical protein
VISIETEYDDQYLTIEAKPNNGSSQSAVLEQENDLDSLKELVATFPKRLEEKLSGWQKQLDDMQANGNKVVLWGSGSKGVSFLATLDAGDKIEYVVDINPHRQGYYMSGTGQEIVSPDFLKEYQPDVVIVMNAIYCDEIGQDLKKLGLSPKIIAV